METYIIKLTLTLTLTMNTSVKLLTILLVISVSSADFVRILQTANPPPKNGSTSTPNG